MDEDKKAWQLALKQENMGWSQLIVPDSKKKMFNSKFEIGAIPYIIFLDNKGKLICSFIGIQKDSFDTYKNIIEENLKKE